MQREYETERLLLKVPDKAEAPAVLDFYWRNLTFLSAWEPARGPEFYTLGFHAAQLEKDLAAFEALSDVRFWLFKKGRPEEAVGSVAFSNIVRGAFLSCFLSYKCDKDELNKGYITEAAKKGIEVMFTDAGLHRIEANIMPRNTRSFRVAEKLGFYNEGIAYKYLRIHNVWEDHIHMVLRNENME
ncbi:ribosomal-protein-alanine N-acetyltransferase [Sporobacter termitidis DSM 10068]|uniref:Ribosomal-protein-alanine N-acetyltransferase n=1 Tax=Sporobacter termitidis DSM 10068 TaxID=1123282 RepID=A0A1M5TCV4_9FIRM|nr:GNAT family N-acetyltransferase [Sporobacter termitidis]SHH48183.1 ribosomal-protein-alanine N-acetyltransferase [Sporobacter termitidis DSM 10068]